MTAYNVVAVKYVGTKKINAIKIYRSVFSEGLREAKNAVENPFGILMTWPILHLIREEYLKDSSDETFKDSDWEVISPDAASDPMQLKYKK